MTVVFRYCIVREDVNQQYETNHKTTLGTDVEQ